MQPDPREIVNLFETRRRARGPEINRMLQVRRTYNGDLMVPLPEMDEDEVPAVANLLMQGIDQLGMRAGGTGPDVVFPPKSQGDSDIAQARDQRRAVTGWWDMNNLTKKDGRRSRYLVAYGCAPTMVKPVGTSDYHCRQMPYWHVLDPLAAYPAPTNDRDDIEPRDIIIHRHITLGWLQARYPVQASRLYKGQRDRQGNHPLDTKFDLLEYNDAEWTALVVSAPQPPAYAYADPNDGVTGCELLEAIPNRAGMCLGVVPGRITLDRLMGNFDQIIGMFMGQAKMTAYENIAIQRTIFPELWVVSHPGQPQSARIIKAADGKQGVVGEIENGTIVPVNVQPGQMASQAIDRLERAQRVQASIPSDWGAESGSNIRTAKRGQEVMSSATDPTLAELQAILAEAKEAEIARAIAVQKGYNGRKTISFYQSRSGKNVGETYVPNTLFDSDFCWVKYSMPGVDAAGIPIELGQRTQTGQMSQDTARRIDPMIEDPEHERDQVELEGLRMALLKGLEAQAQNGAVSPHEIALIAKLKRSKQGMELEEAVAQAQEAIQNEQAAQAAAAPGAPAAQPGLAQGPPVPGAPQQGGPPPLASILGMLRSPTQQSPAEQQLAPPAQAGQ